MKKAILLWIFSRISGNNETGGKDCQKNVFNMRVLKKWKNRRGARAWAGGEIVERIVR
ncbi:MULTISPECIES: hypothetical protein [Anaerotruncus]|uniref:Uncharacterized protein n=1 Tax=Anaerotruncus massiliensis (ex Togo et al. 2019) TaxID=1673720 RepID=A0ABR7AFG1_9FIRM|nr:MULTISPECIES: hypothetical protein [Anaerotruncus]MBC3939165.1 hypothetical protein [Anaerotruncus massiliensis (ex Togo et al. 2019)]MCQ4897453.1 hypothetical protein [Anaerotruncus sp. DFI.9.16]